MQVSYYADDAGVRPVYQYASALQRSGQRGAFSAYQRAVSALELHGSELRMPHSRLIDAEARVFELRFRDHRVAYAFIDGSAVLLHAWRKRSQKLDQAELGIALRRLAELQTE